ncbi:hypothetical protein BK011_05825 [Tenericutes bacterium MZ-XQ]|jgi:hypothetical protein|nr:hypothetical protein BK011_05825 [Tenericutes bacterium MZ-XQ]
MSLVSIKLNDYLEKAGIDETEKLISSFFCSRDEDVDYFIHEKAIPFEYSDHSRTTLLCWLDEEKNELELIAYFAIAGQVFYLDRLSATLQKKIRGNGVKKSSNSIPAFLIGQIGKNDRATYPIGSEVLFNEIFKSVQEINKYLPSRLIYLHCKDIPKLRNIYESKGFQLLVDVEGNPILYEGAKEEYLIYIMSMKELNRILSENEKQ